MLELKSGKLRGVFSELGARLLSLEVDGVDVVFGSGLNFTPETWDEYSGVTCGRYAGRITGPSFRLDGATHNLTPNQDGFQLHGGPKNFANTKWASSRNSNAITFTIESPDGDQGFPGKVNAKSVYSISENALICEIEATTTKPTVLNLTNHAYWNMAGPSAGKDAAFAQDVKINGSHYLPLSPQLLPTGEIAPVAGTRWDFREPRPVGEAYDNCFVLDGKRGEMKQALVMRDPASGRRMEVWTTECAVQFYTAIHWDGSVKSNHGKRLEQHQAIAIEPQNLPDAPNHTNFPSSVVRPGETYRNRIEWRFS